MADNNTTITDAAASRISTLTGVSKACINAASSYEIPPSQVSVDSASKEAVLAVVHMLSSLGPGTTADEFRMQLNLLQESVPALRDQKEEQEQAATSEEFKVQLRYLSRQCDFAIQILDDEKAKYMGNMVVLHQELQVKTAAEAGAFDGDWKAVEATDYWPGEVLKRLQELVERRPLGEKREAYVKEIEAYWKDFAGKEAAQLYQKG